MRNFYSTSSRKRQYNGSKGFTLIELLVVFSIIGIIASVSMASFVSYSRSQTLKASMSEMSTLFSQAKSRAQSQVKPAGCGASQLIGYEVRICGLTGSTCSEENTYKLYVHCGATPIALTTKVLPSTLSFSTDDTTSVSYLFRVLNQGVVGAGQVAMTGYNQVLTLSVTSSGTVSVQ